MRLAVFFFACLFLLWWISAPAQNSATPLVTRQITMILSGVCPLGFSEVAALNGKTVIGTVLANGDVGTTGGSNSITPAGTVSAPTFTGQALATHQHELPMQYSNTDTQIRIIPPGVFGTGTSRAAAVQWTRSNNATVAPVMMSQGVGAGTPAGTNSAPTFTGTSFDNRSAWVKVIFCVKD